MDIDEPQPTVILALALRRVMMLKIRGVLRRFSGTGLQTPRIFPCEAAKRVLNALACELIRKLSCTCVRIEGALH